MRRLPPLSSLRAFEAVARLGSVTKAADEIGRTHGAVSRQLRGLQEAFGAPLFEKEGTGLRLNRSGRLLAETVRDAIADLERGWVRLVSETRQPGLHVACSATFAMRWLMPRLPDFHRLRPEIALRLSMTDAQRLRTEGADLVIAWDRSSYSLRERARAIPLAPVRFGPVCAPGYPIARESDKSGQGDGIVFAVLIGHDFTLRSWDLWQERTGLRAVCERERRFPHTHLGIEAAVGGLGVALAEERLVTGDLASERLVAPVGFVPFEEGLAAVPLTDRAEEPAGRAFLAWLRDSLAA